VKRLTFDNSVTFGPTWTADGRDIIFVSGQLSTNVSLWRIAASGSGKPQLGLRLLAREAASPIPGWSSIQTFIALG
jgi:Tol biopolymer transport system component